MSIYPTAIVSTPLGDIQLNFINGEYITAVIEGIEHRGNVYHGHIYMSYAGGEFRIDGRFSEGCRARRADGTDASDAAKKKIAEVVLEFTNQFAVTGDGRKMLRLGDIDDKLKKATRLAEKVQQAQKALKEAEDAFNACYSSISEEDREFFAAEIKKK